ncbi:MAG: type II secretion system F family protein [Peptococcaceae bacterium]|nr:type II secretion system F family protein [Peptococcaceae bacterium]
MYPLAGSVIFVYGSVFLATIFILLAVYLILFGSRIEISARAVEVIGPQRPTIRERELSAPIAKRVFRPLLNWAVRLVSRRLPSEKEAHLSQKLIMAGRPGGLGAREIWAVKLILATAGLALSILALSFLNWTFTLRLAVTLSAAAAGWMLPDVYLNHKIRERKLEVQKALPDVLDLITVSVEAGMGFDGALMKVVEKGKGILASEFLVVLQECKMGKSRKEALRDMANRIDVDDFSTFTGAIIMADQLGIAIGNVLRLQSDQMRIKRKQRAEENAMKAPVKMLIPMVACIFPTIFVVLLGPAVISLLQNFAIL